jgi:hypothetical protein
MTATYQPGRVRRVYRLGDGSRLCDACIADTAKPTVTLADITDRDDSAHCLGCDYHAAGTPETCPICANLREVRFVFVDSPAFPGWTDDTTWNGFLNVRVTPETLDAIMAWSRDEEPEYWRQNPDPNATERDYGPAIDAMGLVNLGGGYAAEEVGR